MRHSRRVNNIHLVSAWKLCLSLILQYAVVRVKSMCNASLKYFDGAVFVKKKICVLHINLVILHNEIFLLESLNLFENIALQNHNIYSLCINVEVPLSYYLRLITKDLHKCSVDLHFFLHFTRRGSSGVNLSSKPFEWNVRPHYLYNQQRNSVWRSNFKFEIIDWVEMPFNKFCSFYFFSLIYVGF